MCKNGYCICKPGYYEKNGLCFGELGEEVDAPELCDTSTTIEYRDGKCLCNKNLYYQPTLRTCIKTSEGIIEPCTRDFQCSPFGLSFCNPTTPKDCLCHQYAVHDPVQQMCISKTGIQEYCKDTTDCSLKNTVCSAENTCLCAPNYVEKEEQCLPSEGAACEKDDDCVVEDSECVAEEIVDDDDNELKVCRCKADYIYYQNQCYVKGEV